MKMFNETNMIHNLKKEFYFDKNFKLTADINRK